MWRRRVVISDHYRGQRPRASYIRWALSLSLMGAGGIYLAQTYNRGHLEDVDAEVSIDISTQTSARQDSAHDSADNSAHNSALAPDESSSLDQLNAQPAQASALKTLRAQYKDLTRQLAREREHHALTRAELEHAQVERREFGKLFEFTSQLTARQVTLAMITSPPDQALHLPFSICVATPEQATRIKSGDLVAAQGVLLGEIIKPLRSRSPSPSSSQSPCFQTLPVMSTRSSFEVRLSQTGVRGVAVGLGERAGEETVDESIRLKYLERSAPALIGERVYLVQRTLKYQEDHGVKSAQLNSLPALVLGEVVNAQIKDNGLFQRAGVTSPLRREALSWVIVISRP